MKQSLANKQSGIFEIIIPEASLDSNYKYRNNAKGFINFGNVDFKICIKCLIQSIYNRLNKKISKLKYFGTIVFYLLQGFQRYKVCKIWSYRT